MLALLSSKKIGQAWKQFLEFPGRSEVLPLSLYGFLVWVGFCCGVSDLLIE